MGRTLLIKGIQVFNLVPRAFLLENGREKPSEREHGTPIWHRCRHHS